MSSLSTPHLLGIKNLTAGDIESIFSTADNFKEVINRPIKKVPSLRDITIANLFFENSTRTKLSFELAEKRLSADVINFASSSSSVSKGETLIDTVNNILAMKVDIVVMRHPKPCLQKLGAEVMVCGPATLIPKFIGSLGVKVSHDLREALAWCDVANVLRIQLERQDIAYFPSLREYTMMYGIDKKMLESLDKEITVMHPGPINRGVEISSDAADSGQSIILNQVENGVAVRMSVLYLLAGKIERKG
ncbi:MAG: aspartate carbamoyltransferase [Flavobacteriales bacterium]|nr:aspartate carbamoyltransferase [Flavobacteriales bacterium]